MYAQGLVISRPPWNANHLSDRSSGNPLNRACLLRACLLNFASQRFEGWVVEQNAQSYFDVKLGNPVTVEPGIPDPWMSNTRPERILLESWARVDELKTRAHSTTDEKCIAAVRKALRPAPRKAECTLCDSDFRWVPLSPSSGGLARLSLSSWLDLQA